MINLLKNKLSKQLATFMNPSSRQVRHVDASILRNEVSISISRTVEPLLSINLGPHCSLRLVSTQENKHGIGLDFCPSDLVLSAPLDQKKLKIFQLFIGCGSQVQTGTENWYQKPMHGFNFVPIRSDPMLIFLSGNLPLVN